MPRLVIKKLTLLRNCDGPNFRSKFLRKIRNEIYLRCICWIGNDYKTIQYYPSKELLQNFEGEQAYLLQEPTFYMKIKETKDFTVHNDNDDKGVGGIQIFDSNSSKKFELLRDLYTEEQRLRNLKHYLKIIKKFEALTSSKLNEAIILQEKLHKIKELILNSKEEICKLNTSKLLYHQENPAINFIIQVIDSDEEYVKSGRKIKDMAQYIDTFFNPWETARKAYYQAEIARREAEDTEFVKNSLIDPTTVPKMITSMIKGGISFVSNILENNQDDIVVTFTGTATKNLGLLEQPDHAKIMLEYIPDTVQQQKNKKKTTKVVVNKSIIFSIY